MVDELEIRRHIQWGWLGTGRDRRSTVRVQDLDRRDSEARGAALELELHVHARLDPLHQLLRSHVEVHRHGRHEAGDVTVLNPKLRVRSIRLVHDARDPVAVFGLQPATDQQQHTSTGPAGSH